MYNNAKRPVLFRDVQVLEPCIPFFFVNLMVVSGVR